LKILVNILYSITINLSVVADRFL